MGVPENAPIDSRSRECGAGYSLIEIVTVLAVVGLLTSIAVPLIQPGRWRADSAVQETMSTLGAAQREAVMRQHDVAVTFQSSSGWLRVHRDLNNDGAIDAGEDIRVVQLPEDIGFSRGPAPAFRGAIDDVSFRDGGDGPRLTFHRNGSASESGTAYLRPIRGSLSSDSEAVRALTVERATGMVQCFSYRTGSWEDVC